MKVLNLTLWIAQLLTAILLLWAGYVKIAKPITELAAMWPWAGEVSATFVRFTGVIDLLGALGLILPAALRIQPRLTPVAAVGIILLMICATVFHLLRGEGANIGFNIGVIVIAAFIAWGRFTKAPIV
ncbi:DoxX family protein [Spirosoma sp. KUDC1026]|uniref:DoxX family protein n=1 Tax=Spirosoma sp. KUDC1026 TaxID=2745947 RepID=UPI00159B8FD8|nr:DoxX family protein [Spirosoma sp. KUDC1026]QKZ14131.1 DoxX family protein [Spirosoma sp. KUDC1026]